jgi:hypothetical protein
VGVPGFQAEYFARYGVLAHSAVEASIDHIWAGETAEPAEGVGSDFFSVRYTATLHVPQLGAYSFATVADDGVRLWVNDTLLIDDWNIHGAERHEGTIELAAGDATITLEYFEAQSGSTCPSSSWPAAPTSKRRYKP